MSGSSNIAQSRRYHPHNQPPKETRKVHTSTKVSHPVKPHDIAPPPSKEHKSSSSNDGSFIAEENTNELVNLISGGKSTKKSPRHIPPDKREFEHEMDQYGFLGHIAHIEKLNNFFEHKLGPNACPSPKRKKSDAENEAKEGPALQTHGFSFPFQKRARSHSPLRNSQLTDQCKAKPVIANFLIVNKPVENSLKKADWMYQRLNENKEPEGGEENLEDECEENDGIDFMEYINNLS